jgi:enoyl-CoA hydratase/carnithine racemase
VGYSPDGGWTALLPFAIGIKRAAEVQLLNQSITPEQAVAWGIASRIVPAETIRQEAHAIAVRIAQQKPGSIHRTKHLLWGDIEQIGERLQAERRSFVEQMDSSEAQDGMADFLEKIR